MATQFGNIRFYTSVAGSPRSASVAGSAFDARDWAGPILGLIIRGAATGAGSAEIQVSDDNSSWSTLTGASISMAASATGNPGVHRFLITSSSGRYYRWKFGEPASGSIDCSGLFAVVTRHDTDPVSASSITVVSW